MNIFLTGATGFVGKKLAKELLSEGHTLYILCRNTEKAEAFSAEMPASYKEKIVCLQGNLLNDTLGFSEEEINNLSGVIDAIYHMAAYLSFDPSQREDTFAINLDGTRHTLELAERIRCQKFLYVSTAYTIGMETKGQEDLYSLDRDFVNPYEESKAHAEHLVYSYKEKMDICILRPSIIIGDSTTGEAETTFGVYGLMKAAALLKRKVRKEKEGNRTIYHFLGEADLKMNLVPVDYVTKVLKSALYTKGSGKIYNITDPDPLSQKEIFQAIKEVLDFPNMELIPFSKADTLKPIEETFNQPMSIFENYFRREIQFPSENTRELLKEAGIQPLQLHYNKLKFILSGNRK
ncbi:SDR family NAD(P)-dependent oxidoreductase [Bacillus salacetis]|uniref:SDR family NAD(P)-dependent oxidoreductase n=1 Tax=Bacillus salacetis TaxID=2315464 RepID=A0A3A1R056_9BACI|nr:SDR family oxidoreductase [Bacillus salacetis]RIW34738.1 SDR family NAD(P)-dependent oxidoreductase [Bacillus salacetis]